jgi:flagellin-like hook-associated protein FlgL
MHGQIEGVKYDQLSVVLINAIHEQEAQIKQQQTRLESQKTQIDSILTQIGSQQNQIERSQSQIESLLKVLCLDHPRADICKKR